MQPHGRPRRYSSRALPRLYYSALILVAATAAWAQFTQSFDITVTIGGTVPFTPLHQYYLAATGCSDGNTGTSPGSPWCTPNHAVVCGDVIIAAAGTYSTGQFNGNWGNVTNCPSTTGGIDGAGGIYFAVLLCGGTDLVACTVTGSSPVLGFNSGQHNWAVEGFLVPNVPASRAFEIRTVNGACNATFTSHHIASINNVVYNSGGAFEINDCGAFQGANPPAVDYLAVVGTIAQNAAQDNICLGAIDFVGTGASDSATTAIKGFMYGNFAWNNVNTNCDSLYDNEGMMFDTIETHSSNGIWVNQNNISFYNGRYGFQLFYQFSSSTAATVHVLNNTFFANNSGNVSGSTTSLEGDLNIGVSTNFTTAVPFTLLVQNNIAKTNWQFAGGGSSSNSALFAMVISGLWSSATIGGTGNENIFKGMQTGCIMFHPYTTCDPGFNVEATDASSIGTNIYVDPAFTNTADLLASRLGAPNCTGFRNVTACMGWNANTNTLTTPSVISDLTATCAQCSGKGFQRPSLTCAANPDYPPWLKGIVYLQVSGSAIVMANDLVTKPCGM